MKVIEFCKLTTLLIDEGSCEGILSFSKLKQHKLINQTQSFFLQLQRLMDSITFLPHQT